MMIAGSMLWNLIIFYSPLSALAAAVNWTENNVDSNNNQFYNGPRCQLPNLGWNNLKNPDGSLYTASKRPITILYDAWESSMLNSYVGQYLLEGMGYRVQVVTRIQYILGPEFEHNTVDLEMELWPQDFTNFVQLTQTDKVAVSLGASGYNGNIGLYIPTYLLDQYPDWSLDFWRFLLNPESRSIFPAFGTGPRILIDGKPECDSLPGLCVNGSYIPKQCLSPSSKCIELWHYDPGYSTNIFQRLIDGLKLPVVINFLGFGAESILQESIDAKKAILLFNWTPTKFVANTNLTKVLFPNNNPSQYAAFAKDMSKVLTTDPQSSILQKVASLKFVADFPELNSFVTKYQIPDDQINAMLKAMTHDSLDAAHVACLWLKNNQDLWDSWIPALPKSVVSCPIGMGRYLTGAAYSCISCPIGSYNWQPNNTQQCAPCPNNFDCQGGLTVNVLEGLWMPNRTDIPVAYTCPMHSSCCHQHSCPALTCAHDFKGILCTECAEEGFYLWGSECHQCGSAGGASFYAVVALAFVCAFALLLLPYEEAPTVELLFFYFQVARYIFETQVNGILNVPGISTFLSIASLNVDGFVTDCPLPLSGINKLLFRFFLPSLILVYIVTIYFGLRALNARFPKTHSILMSWAPEHLRHESVSLICFRAIIIVMTFVTMPLIDSSLLLLQCTEIEGKNVLSQVPQVECFSSQHAAAAALAVVVLIAMIVGLPCLISLVLYKLWKADLIVYDEEGLTPIQKLFQCLYIIFKPEMFYMLPVTIVEKGVISILFAMMSRYPSLVQMNTYIIVLSGLCGTRIYWQPFANHLEAYLNREIALGILAMIALRQFTDQYGVSNFALAEIGFAIFLPPVLHIIRWIQGNYQKHKEVIGQVIRKASLNGSKSSKSGFTDSNTESQSQTQTVTRKRTMIASGKKSSIEKLNASTRSNLRSFNASRKTINTLADENKPLNLNPTFP